MSSIDSALMSDVDLKRSAETLIAEFGDTAWAEAEARAQAMRSEGFESMAETWELVREAIGEIQQGNAQRIDGYRAALSKGVLLSE